MADLITLTATPIRITGATSANIWSARDVSAYDMIDIEVGVVAWQSPSSASLDIQLISGFQLDSYDDWMPATNTTLDEATPMKRLSLSWHNHKYLTWRVTSLSGATSATLWIRGMVRMSEDQ